MMEAQQKLQLWGPGPWVNEPDISEFEAHGLKCIVARHEECGHLCGYVRLPHGHPLHGTEYAGIEEALEEHSHGSAHGGITYAGPLEHLDPDGRHSGVPAHEHTIFRPWWVGFDAAHHMDYVPSSEKMMQAYRPVDLGERQHGALDHQTWGRYGNIYRDLAYMTEECRDLAEALTKAGHSDV